MSADHEMLTSANLFHHANVIGRYIKGKDFGINCQHLSKTLALQHHSEMEAVRAAAAKRGGKKVVNTWQYHKPYSCLAYAMSLAAGMQVFQGMLDPLK